MAMTKEMICIVVLFLFLIVLTFSLLWWITTTKKSNSVNHKQDPHRLRSIRWFDETLNMDIKRRIVTIDGQKCRILTSNELNPGTFGLRMQVGCISKIRLHNELPFATKATCVCDADLAMHPATNTNPCWTNLHFHGFWGSANQDDVYRCVKPEEKSLYAYHLNPNHPTGIYIEHVHNFSSSVTQDHITPFILKIEDGDKPDYPCRIRQLTLFLVLAYMQECPPNDPDQCKLESFDFPKYASGDFTIYSTLLKAGPKLLLVNGQIQPFECLPTHTTVILRVGWMGILDVLRFRIVDGNDTPISFRILSIDSLVIAGQCDSCDTENTMIVTEFLAAHMQRFDVMVIFPKPGTYRLIKFTTPADDTSPFSVPTRTMMTIYAKDENDQGSDAECSLTDLKLQNSYWVQQVNQRFRNLSNLAAWRNMRFNFPQFPEIEGSMFDLTVLPAQIVMVANRSEVWLVGSAGGLHSLHIHLQWFLIMAERKTENDPWVVIPKKDQWFQDTLVLESGRQFLVWMFPFADSRVSKENRATGLAMTHCHMSDHTDSDMMFTMLVSDDPNVQPSGVGLVMGAQTPEILDITRRSSCGIH